MAKKFETLTADWSEERKKRVEVLVEKMIAEMEQQDEQGIWQYGIGGAHIPSNITIVEPEEVHPRGYSEVGGEKEIENDVGDFEIGGEG